MKPSGQVSLECKTSISGRKINECVTFQVVKGKGAPILGKGTCEKFGLLKRVHQVSTSNDPPVLKHNLAANEKPPVMPKSATDPPHKPSKRALELLEKNQDLFEGLGCLKGREYDIAIDPSVAPVQLPPRQIPHKIQDRVKEELERMTNLGVIEPITEATEWVSQITTVMKKNGKVRVCLDPRELNKAIRRQHYPMTTLESVAAKLANAKIFSKFDATSGYWQLQLSEESSKLTTFNTPWGRYKFNRMPFGISSASEIWQRAMVEEFGEVAGIGIIVDDMLLSGVNDDQHDDRLEDYFNKVRESGLKLNRPKSEISVDHAEYSGHMFTDHGLEPSPERIRALKEMPEPQNRAELETFLGIMVYLAKFVPNLSRLAAPHRTLLEKGVEWSWEPQQTEAYRQLIDAATTAPALRYYDTSKPVTLATDASNQGFGAMICQEEQPVAYASHRLNQAEKNYAAIEKEMCAIQYGCARFHDYIFGAKTTVTTDHKPLVSIFQKPLHKLSPRLQRMRLALLRYDLEVVWVPGKSNFIPDALSRATLPDEPPEDNDAQDVWCITSQLPVTDAKLQELHETTARDPVLVQVQRVIRSGWPGKQAQVSHEVRPYYAFREELVCCDGLLFRGNQIVIPGPMRPQMLQRLHSSHQGVVKTKQRAKSILFWPGINAQI
jgi:hypothetical protein